MKRTGLARRNANSSSRSSTETRRKPRRSRNDFAVCIDNRGYEASLEAGKLYRVLPDVAGESHGLLRVVDESGEDYGYNTERFFRLAVPHALAEALTPRRVRRSSAGRP